MPKYVYKYGHKGSFLIFEFEPVMETETTICGECYNIFNVKGNGHVSKLFVDNEITVSKDEVYDNIDDVLDKIYDEYQKRFKKVKEVVK